VAFGIYVKIAFNDGYIYAVEGTPTVDEIIDLLKENLGEKYYDIEGYKITPYDQEKEFMIKLWMEIEGN